MKDDRFVRYCKTCRWSKDGHNAGTEECHLCMWENQNEPRRDKKMTRAEYLDSIDREHQCCICEEFVDPNTAVHITGPADSENLPEFKNGGMLVCPRCYKREIASSIWYEPKELDD